MNPKLPPLNGTKTHPLTAHARSTLLTLSAYGPMPRQNVNPGVSNRLLRECLVEEVSLPSPFKSHKGSAIAHLRITDAGRAAMKGQP